ncbi:MAG: phosphatidate cytidylyltransferase [Planctomycetota bacterium]|nr:phosphatidate cytidylyltransferase [Planctomycetaceae bacterium]MDQ3332928.1 phosphatidate cytidylyltransferase [Planctomycetota bacterium]
MSTTPSNWSSAATALATTGARATSVWDRLDAQELRRRASHMAPGLLPFILWGIPHRDPLSTTAQVIFVAIFVALTAVLFLQWSRISRSGVGSGDRIAAIYGYACSVLLTLLLFPAHAECGLAVLGVLAFGDGSATFFGKLFGGPRLLWNPNKSIAGFLGFLCVGLPVTALIYWGESNNLEAIGPPATMSQAALVAAAGVVAGAFAETIESRVNDNVRVGLASAFAIVSAHALLFGL